MRKIKIAYIDFWSTDLEEFVVTCALRTNYDVEIVANVHEADYVFYSDNGDEHWFLPLDKIKIYYTQEVLCPDFNACDYAIGFNWMDFGDRFIRLPNNYGTVYQRCHTTALFEKRYEHPLTENQLRDLTYNREFCSFVVSNGKGNPIRRQLFDALSHYKQVESGGKFMNNVGGPVEDRIAFESQHKFSISCENTSHPGYTTEKIFAAFAARTIPIYWGDPDICKVFNPKAFVNVMDFPSIDAVVERVKELDYNNEAYMAMLNEPALLVPSYYSISSQMKRLADFLQNIVEQPSEKAQRHDRGHYGNCYFNRERLLVTQNRKSFREIFKDKIRCRFDRFLHLTDGK